MTTVSPEAERDAASITIAGSERLTLPDGTLITFQGFSGLTTGNFL